MKTKKKTKQTEEWPPMVQLLCFLFLLLSFILPYLPKPKAQKSQELNIREASRASASFYARMDNMSNPKKLTIEEVKRYKQFANISDEDAKEIIDGLYKLSIISYNVFKYGTGKL